MLSRSGTGVRPAARVMMTVWLTSGSVYSARSAAAAPRFLGIDFKKGDGFLRSLKRSAELGLYRQSHCGCEFSRLRRTGGAYT